VSASLQQKHVGGRNYVFIKRRRVNHVEKQYACHDRNAANRGFRAQYSICSGG
jgi:hypothetical protein